jgi:Ca2+-binding EF-hand superfamily protein
MKRQFQFNPTVFRSSVRLLICCFLASGLALQAQSTTSDAAGPKLVLSGAPPSDGAKIVMLRGDGANPTFIINGSEVGTILLATCDLDQDGKVGLPELKEIAAACFKLWDTNSDGSISGSELYAALKELFPVQPPHRVRVVNGVAVTVPSIDARLARSILGGADSNKDGALSLQEISDFLDRSFTRWDQDGSGSLDAQELNAAFGQLAKAD